MKYLCEKIGEKILDTAFTAAIGEIVSYVTAWCWNQASVQEMRRKFAELLVRAKIIKPTAQQSNTTNFQVQQLLRELQNEAEQGKELLDGQLTPVNLSNAKERFERIMSNAKEKFERIREVALKLNDLLLSNAREAGVHEELLDGQPTPVMLDDLLLSNAREAGVHEELLDGQPTPVKLDDLFLSNAREAGVHTEMKQPQFKPRYLNRRTRFQVIRGYNCS